ncbi:DUF3899 domain-containing protein [Sporosarcina sp. HYO08]|uniref:DUF3899 domain-containing protein n=1 Tax=Sporosarcina sp. HYO08 TaxID=1759557 RepID=UPI00079535D0|nr:DUF3899 domain-containing protein [Sporosarcina sp. HYO08]KXH80731.1 hypothetical protein AU377_08275 [Sporosarcina sp. HYO08]
MRKGLCWTIAAIGFLALVLFVLDVGMAVWDTFFLTGLVLFMCGGAFLLLEKGIFNFFFLSFRKFLKSTSKAEEYVSEVNGERQVIASLPMKFSFTRYLLLVGVAMLVVATVFPVYFIQ